MKAGTQFAVSKQVMTPREQHKEQAVCGGVKRLLHQTHLIHVHASLSTLQEGHKNDQDVRPIIITIVLTRTSAVYLSGRWRP